MRYELRQKINHHVIIDAITAFLVFCMVILFFCPIIVIEHAPSPSERVRVLSSPFLTIYSFSSIFLLLIPLIAFFVITIISFFKKNKLLDILMLLLTLYINVVSVCFLYSFEFTLVGTIFVILICILMLVLSVVKICITARERKIL